MRYQYIERILNNEDQYYNLFKERQINFVEQYPTAVIRSPSIDFKLTINKVPHVWSSGDKYFSLAEKYYDNMRYWYLIAWYNQKPTEQHNSIGDIIYIPLPISKVLSYYNGE